MKRWLAAFFCALFLASGVSHAFVHGAGEAPNCVVCQTAACAPEQSPAEETPRTESEIAPTDGVCAEHPYLAPQPPSRAPPSSL